jgi:hypothetical protein
MNLLDASTIASQRSVNTSMLERLGVSNTFSEISLRHKGSPNSTKLPSNTKSHRVSLAICRRAMFILTLNIQSTLSYQGGLF